MKKIFVTFLYLSFLDGEIVIPGYDFGLIKKTDLAARNFDAIISDDSTPVTRARKQLHPKKGILKEGNDEEEDDDEDVVVEKTPPRMPRKKKVLALETDDEGAPDQKKKMPRPLLVENDDEEAIHHNGCNFYLWNLYGKMLAWGLK